MRAKDLALVLAGAVIFGGGAGALAAYLLGSTAPPAEAPDSALAERVKRLELTLEDTQQKLRQTERRRGQLEEKVTKAEIRLAGIANREAAEEAAAAETATVFGSDGTFTVGGPGRSAGGRKKAVAGHVLGGKGRALQAISLDMTNTLEQFRKAAALRALSEDERWDKAREDVHLTDGQILEIQSAIEERDAAIEAAKTSEEVVTSSGSTMRTVKMDGEKMKAAQDKYGERVDNLLATDQKTAWKEGGYDRAFGKRRGHAAAIFISTNITETTETKD